MSLLNNNLNCVSFLSVYKITYINYEFNGNSGYCFTNNVMYLLINILRNNFQLLFLFSKFPKLNLILAIKSKAIYISSSLLIRALRLTTSFPGVAKIRQPGENLISRQILRQKANKSYKVFQEEINRTMGDTNIICIAFNTANYIQKYCNLLFDVFKN